MFKPIRLLPTLSIRGGALALVALALACAGLLYAPLADARGGHAGHSGNSGHGGHGGSHWRGGAFIGGVVVGSVLARPYYYPYSSPYYAPSYYYPPAAYYPPTVYAAPPAPVTYIEQQPNYVTAPQAATPQLPIEQRAQRLKAMCDRGLFTPQECASRREEILRGM